MQADAPLVSGYCQRARGNELILVGMDDDLYASTLPLAKLRYCLVGANLTGGRYGMNFGDMGIILTAAQFDGLDQWEPVFRQRLREWGLDSGEPIGTLILAGSPEELARTIGAHPGSDFLLPRAVPRRGGSSGAGDSSTGGGRGEPLFSAVQGSAAARRAAGVVVPAVNRGVRDALWSTPGRQECLRHGGLCRYKDYLSTTPLAFSGTGRLNLRLSSAMLNGVRDRLV